ncbi:MAG: hypothetical protein ACRDVE_06435 [Actinocrinis sp.]
MSGPAGVLGRYTARLFKPAPFDIEVSAVPRLAIKWTYDANVDTPCGVCDSTKDATLVIANEAPRSP